MSNVLEEDDGYDSIDEDAELELSCALHDLALRVKTFEENMKDRFHHADGDDEGEISEEDIPEMDDTATRGRGTASPKRSNVKSTRHRWRLSDKAAKQQSDDDDDGDNDELYDDDEDHELAGDDEEEEEGDADRKGQPREQDEWDFQEQKEELSEMRQNIALLLQTIKAEAKALECYDDDTPVADDNNQ